MSVKSLVNIFERGIFMTNNGKCIPLSKSEDYHCIYYRYSGNDKIIVHWVLHGGNRSLYMTEIYRRSVFPQFFTTLLKLI